MRKAKRFICMLLACCMTAALLPAVSMARAAGSLLAEKGYVLSCDEEFEYKFTPSETGIYQVSAEGWEAEDVGRMEITDSNGEWVAGRSYGMEKFYAFLEEGETYTYFHRSLMEGDNYYVLEICYYPALALSTDRNASYRRSGDDWTEFVEFTPEESAWYTFKDSGRALLYGVYAEGGVPFYDIPGTFTERGQHIYLEKGLPVILEVWLYSETGSISVEKASFKTLAENSSVKLTLEDADDGMMVDGGAFCDDYVCFTPGKSGTYKVSFTPESDKVFSWGGSFSVKDSKGNGVSSENWSWAEHTGEYRLTAGEIYYIGASAMPGGVCEISAKLIKAEEVRCEKHKYTSATGDICTVCGYEFEPELIACSETLYAAENNAAVRDKPYAKAGELVYALVKGTKVEPTHYFYNALGNKWYLLKDGKYIYSERLTDKGPKYYTLSFNANGSGVSNLPETMKIMEGVRGAIPGAVSKKPERIGYTFLGYSTNKNATSAEYVPGKSIILTSNLTLYAVWESDDDYIAYRKKVDAIWAAIGDNEICENQINRIKKSGTKYVHSVGNCNIASVVTLLNRNLYYEGKTSEKRFTLLNAYSANGCGIVFGPTLDYTPNKYRRYGYEYTGNTGSWHLSRKYTNNSGTSYTVTNESLATINKNKGSLSYEEYFASLLRKHPEGICIRKKSGDNGHVCVITHYEIIDGKYQFYVQDPVNQFTGRFEDSYQYGTYGAMSQNIDFIAYIR